MKRIVGIVLFACLAVPGTMQAADKEELATYKDKLSYSMGHDMGTYLNSVGDDLDLDRLLEGLKAAYDGKESVLSREEMQAVQKEFAQKMQAKQEAAMLALQEANKKAGDEFLAANKKKDGVIVTESGLQYEIITPGKGNSPKAEETVTVHYTGKTIDGTVFDDSTKRGDPAVFGVNQVIPGWTEVLQLMKEGAKYRVVIPPNLAYGQRGVPPMIEPNSVLVFDVELISVGTSEAVKEKAAKALMGVK
jgi:peptidylprolyl isomerase/FKBP-type peptidyl-prolyl cis-trans isomerase FklB